MKFATKFKIKDIELKNRIVMPPMCMGVSDDKGMVKDFHKLHYATRAVGGVGLIISESIAIEPNGRISNKDLGIWSDDHIAGLKDLVDKIKSYGSKTAIQLSHAGRKCSVAGESLVAPSVLRHSDKYEKPKEMSQDDIRNMVKSFKEAARRANEAGFDIVEIHAAHGYLIHQFLSPITNKRTDEYGGSLEGRVRFLKEILEEISKVWPKDKPIFIRVSATDYVDGGMDEKEMVKIINQVKDYIDVVDVSTGGLVNVKIKSYPGYQAPYAEIIKDKCNIPTITAGQIRNFEQIEEILSNGRADLVALGRKLLNDPYFVLNIAHENKLNIDYPKPYMAVYH